jgi:hypothetical protein
MTNQRMAGEEIFERMQATQQSQLQENQRVRSIMERQRRRDVAAAAGRMVPFSKADII